MEHDTQNIREKVLSAECHEVTWRKAELWERLRTVDAPRRNTPWYLAAAAVLLITVGTAYWFQVSIRENALQRLAALEDLYQKEAMNKLPEPTTQAEAACPESPPVDKTPTLHRKSRSRETPSVAMAQPGIQLTATPVIALTIEKDSVSNHSVLTFEEQDAIKPIVGVFDISKETSSHKPKRKNKLKLMRSSELVYSDKKNAESALMARIK